MWLLRSMRYVWLPFQYVWLGFFLIPFLVGIGGIVWGTYASSFSMLALRAEGNVAANQLVIGSGDTASAYYPEVEFVTRDGRSHRFTGSSGADPPSFQVGERVTVAYKEGDRDNATIDSFSQLFLGPLLLCGLGFGWLIPVWFFSSRKMRKDDPSQQAS